MRELNPVVECVVTVGAFIIAISIFGMVGTFIWALVFGTWNSFLNCVILFLMGVLLTPIIGVILQMWVAVLKKKEEEL